MLHLNQGMPCYAIPAIVRVHVVAVQAADDLRRVTQRGEIAVHDAAILALVGCARFYSVTYRLFKLPGLLEPACEDYGHVVTYKARLLRHDVSPCQRPPARWVYEDCSHVVSHKVSWQGRQVTKHVYVPQGSIPDQPYTYALDEAHVFEKGRPARACGNTAAMVGEGGLSWLTPHFTVRLLVTTFDTSWSPLTTMVPHTSAISASSPMSSSTQPLHRTSKRQLSPPIMPLS